MAWIDKNLETYLQQQFSDRIVKGHFIKGTWQKNRYIQISTILRTDMDIHYEYYQGHVELHLEKKYHDVENAEFVKHLRQQSAEITSLSWKKWQGREKFRCQIDKPTNNWNDVVEAFKAIIEIFDPIIERIRKTQNMEDCVTLESKYLTDLLSQNLHIPSYQRIYCWEEEQIRTLLNDIETISTKEYFLGNIILHKRFDENEKQDVFDIVDGQQRLVSLAILNHFVKDENEDFALIKCKFLSIEAQQHVYDNAQIIQKFLEDGTRKTRIEHNLGKLSFGVLTIDQKHLDLAFTFFTNTNSRGKLLTDYELLKPHHLRYIPSDYPLQQQLLATQWDKMINESKKEADDRDKRRDAPYIHVIELLLFRLRKWSRKKHGNETDRFVYAEFKTSPFIEEIPPFGENFDYYEPIQGGQHFFEFVAHFIQKYKEFTSTHENSNNENVPNVYDLLRDNFTGYSDKWYRYVMEALIFCYYIKFGNSFISEATLSIVRYIAQIRFEKARAYEPTIVDFARESEIVIMIEQATSPTFFLAEIESKINTLPGKEVDGIRKTFLNNCKKLSEVLSKKSISISYQNYSQKYERITSK